MSGAMRGLLIGLGAAAAAAVGAVAWVGRAPRTPPDVAIITHGEKVDLAAHAAAGKYTVFDFYAPWCPPCRELGPALERLAGRQPGRLALRKVDIVDWTMPVARQYGVESLPYLVLYDDHGRRLAEGADAFTALSRLFGAEADDIAAFAGAEPARPPKDDS